MNKIINWIKYLFYKFWRKINEVYVDVDVEERMNPALSIDEDNYSHIIGEAQQGPLTLPIMISDKEKFLKIYNK